MALKKNQILILNPLLTQKVPINNTLLLLICSLFSLRRGQIQLRVDAVEKALLDHDLLVDALRLKNLKHVEIDGGLLLLLRSILLHWDQFKHLELIFAEIELEVFEGPIGMEHGDFDTLLTLDQLLEHLFARLVSFISLHIFLFILPKQILKCCFNSFLKLRSLLESQRLH